MPPASRAALLARLDTIGVSHATVDHEAVFTVEESRALHAAIPGLHSKNLFFKDAGDRLWLVTAEADRRIDLKTLHHRIGAKRLSFGKPDRGRAGIGDAFCLAERHGAARDVLPRRGSRRCGATQFPSAREHGHDDGISRRLAELSSLHRP